MDSWENKTEKFLSNAFNEDSKFISGYLLANPVSTIVELGFGNNRLLPYILKTLPNVKYFGFDKTEKFVNMANKEYKSTDLSFSILDIRDTGLLINTLNDIDKELLIIRSVLEHLTNWEKVLQTINDLGFSTILLTKYTGSMEKSISGLRRGRYTINILSDKDMASILYSYICLSSTTFYSNNHRFYVYEKIK